jgi:hypothetical protein
LIDGVVFVIELLSPEGLAQYDEQRRHLLEGKRGRVVPIESRLDRVLERRSLLVG